MVTRLRGPCLSSAILFDCGLPQDRPWLIPLSTGLCFLGSWSPFPLLKQRTMLSGFATHLLPCRAPGVRGELACSHPSLPRSCAWGIQLGIGGLLSGAHSPAEHAAPVSLFFRPNPSRLPHAPPPRVFGGERPLTSWSGLEAPLEWFP